MRRCLNPARTRSLPNLRPATSYADGPDGPARRWTTRLVTRVDPGTVSTRARRTGERRRLVNRYPKNPGSRALHGVRKLYNLAPSKHVFLRVRIPGVI